jgi:signal transduction histidine kinase
VRLYAQIVDRPLQIALGWRIPTWLLDVGPVVVILGEGAIAIAARPRAGISVLVLAAGLAISAGALLLRHRAPLAVLALLLLVALRLNYGPLVTLPILLAVFTVAESTDRMRVIAAAALATAVITLTPFLHGGHLLFAAILSRFVAVGLAVSVGLYLRARADFISGLQERAERLERERELLAEQAVADERLRIARELHDVVAHNVSLMVVQAQALAATTNGDGETDQTLGRVADLGRDALSEMHRMLGVLRVKEGGAPERGPQPGVRDLDALIVRTREAGLDARLEIEGPVRELPAGVDLSAYRIVQEALTNVIRHASAARATVTLKYLPAALDVTVIDDGVGSGGGASAGHGLVGMRERVALFGGRLATGVRDGGDGYEVRAHLPVG